VTGATGFIGSHMVEHLCARGFEVIAGDLPAALAAPRGDRARWPEVCAAAGADLVPLDLTDKESVTRAVRGADLVFHVAAVFDYTAPEALLRRVNVDGTRNLLDALAEEGCCKRVVNWGAGGVYGPPSPEVIPFKEEGPKRPSNAYLRSKLDQEVLAHSYRDKGVDVTSVRPTSPYGPRALYGSGQLLMGLAERPVAFSNLTGNIPFVHVRDLCAAALHLAELADAAGEAYNVTDEGRLDAVALARLVADEMGARPRVLPPLPIPLVRRGLSGAARISMARARRRGARPFLEYDQVQYFGRDYLYSTDKLRATGFNFEWPLPEPGLRATLRWYVDNGWLPRPRAPRRTVAATQGGD
jgi:nucleoside-diphosphate-sugar epimerase